MSYFCRFIHAKLIFDLVLRERDFCFYECDLARATTALLEF